MSQKRSSKPIRITLTEDQISDIIQSAAKTRRSLSAQSLEDRIAPSAIGAPMFDPSLGDPSGPPLPNFDPNNPAPMDPNAGLLPGDPPTPPGFDPPPSGFDPSHPGPVLPGDNPPLPGGQGGDVFGAPGPLPPPLPPLDPNLDPATHHANLLHGNVQPEGFIAPGSTPSDNAPIDPGTPPPADVVPATPGMPTPQEFEEHRRNILRQLRGI
jgi:hypothetical protein